MLCENVMELEGRKFLRIFDIFFFFWLLLTHSHSQPIPLRANLKLGDNFWIGLLIPRNTFLFWFIEPLKSLSKKDYNSDYPYQNRLQFLRLSKH